MNVQQIARSVALASALVASTGVLAATDGTLGATSSGELNVSLAVADRVQITGLDDIALGSYSGTGSLVGGSTFCVYRNGTGVYDLTVTSLNDDSGTFRATDGTDFIAYSVEIDDSVVASNGVLVASGAAQTGLAGNGTSTSCGGADNASLQVTFDELDLQAAPTGSFADVITLLVEPS
jgi:hypothetical protein